MKLQRLRELALGATQGEWIIGDENNQGCEVLLSNDHNLTIGLDRHDKNTGEIVISREEMLANAKFIIAACPANILPFLESYEELLAAAKGYLDNSVRDIGRQGRQAHGALLQAITNAEKLK